MSWNGLSFTAAAELAGGTRSGAAIGFQQSVLAGVGAAHAQQRAICYNCPPEWADWGSQLKAIQEALGIAVPPDNKNSGQSLAALIAEKARPVADVVYLGGSVALPAKEAGFWHRTSRTAGNGSRPD